MQVWTVKRYDDVFENAGSRKLAIPGYLNLITSHDSEAFRWLMRQGIKGHAAFGDFIAIVQILATLGREYRKAGVLVSSGRALGPEHIASRLGCSKAMLEASWVLLSHDECKWLFQSDWNPASGRHNADSDQGTLPLASHPPPNGPPVSSQSPPISVPPARHARATGPVREGMGVHDRDGPKLSLVSDNGPGPVRPPRAATVRVLLVKLRIDGAALDALSACELITPESIISDVREIELDKSVRSVKRVLVERLCVRHNIKLDKGGRTSIGSDVTKLAREFEEIRDRARAKAVSDAEQEREQAVRRSGRATA